MPTAQVIGVDLGGTAIKLARIRADGTVLAEAQWPTPQPAVPGAVTMALCDAIKQIDPEHAAEAVGIGLCTELAWIAITQAPQAGDAGELLQRATVTAVAGRTIGLNPDQTGFRCSAVVAREQLTP